MVLKMFHFSKSFKSNTSIPIRKVLKSCAILFYRNKIKIFEMTLQLLKTGSLSKLYGHVPAKIR